MAPVAASIPQATISRRFNTETALNVLSIYINTGVYPSFSPFTILCEKPLFTLTGNGNVTFRYFLPSTSSLSALSIFDSKIIFLRLPQNIVAQLLNSMQITHIINTFLITLILINFLMCKYTEVFLKRFKCKKTTLCKRYYIRASLFRLLTLFFLPPAGRGMPFLRRRWFSGEWGVRTPASLPPVARVRNGVR